MSAYLRFHNPSLAILPSDAAGAAVRPIASEAMIMSMLLAHEKMMLEVKKSIQELRNPEN